jgi:hypothetical protein
MWGIAYGFEDVVCFHIAFAEVFYLLTTI